MSIAILRGDARQLPLPDASVDLIVCSPPFWQLRSYRDGGEHYDGQIGSEPAWQEYIGNLLDCTREWARVLKPCGSMFIELGDKYANDAKWGGATSGKHVAALHGQTSIGRARASTGIPAKSLMELPHRYAIRCVDDLGLILRAEIPWHHVNGLPESVTDRVRHAHSTVFHFTRQPRYYAAVDCIREPHSENTNPGRTRSVGNQSGNGVAHRTFAGNTDGFNPLGKLPGSVWDIPSQPLFVPERIEHERCCGGKARPGCKDGLTHHAAFPFALPRQCILGWSPPGICTGCGEGRRPVTEVGRAETKPWAMAQRAGRSWHGDGANPARALGASAAERNRMITGWACACTPFTDRKGTPGRERDGQAYARETGRDAHPHGGVGMLPRTGPWREYHMDGWTPPSTRPALVVDPFGGTGTTALVADVLGRDAVTLDRSADYCRLARWRTTDPGERARAMQVPKPPPVPDGQDALFDFGEAS